MTRPQILKEADPFNPGAGLRAIAASSFPVKPPREWFEVPEASEPTPLTITADGQVYGHIAAWGVRHIGLPGNVSPPKSRSNYAYFHTGLVACADGSDIQTGTLTFAGGHAPLSADASRAVEHYDNTCTGVADITVRDGKHGIWASGAMRPDVTETQVRTIRASAPSGDWRPINGGLELVACLQVNTPGFPTVRARVASGAVTALVAAGAQDMMMRRYREADRSYQERLHGLETVVASLVDDKKAQLRKRVK